MKNTPGGAGETLEERRPYFSREMTDILKGIALLFMFAHHFWTFPDWWTGRGVPVFEEIAFYFRNPLKLCVPIFCFITGYTYFFHRTRTFRYSAKKIVNFLILYWISFILLAAFTYCFTDYRYSPLVFIKELLAFERPTMTFCWYVNFYCAFMLILPILSRILARSWLADLLLIFIILPVLFGAAAALVPVKEVSELLGNLKTWFPCVLAGYFTASWKLFEKTDGVFSRIKNKGIKILLCLGVFLLIPMMRNVPFILYMNALELSGERIKLHLTMNSDSVIVFFFIYAVLYLFREIKFPAAVTLVLRKIGQRSMLMWFVSCIFYDKCNTLTQKVLYFTGNPLTVLATGTVICYGAAVLISFLHDILFKPRNLVNKGGGGKR